MRFLMLSDLHLNEDNWCSAKERVQKLCEKLRRETSPADPLMIIFLGDLVDKGDKENFKWVDKLCDELTQGLGGHTLLWESVPGNHDLIDGSLHEYSRYTKEKGWGKITDDCPVYIKDYENTRFIFADSTLSRDYQAAGRLDENAVISSIRDGANNFLFCHYAFTNSSTGLPHDTIEKGKEVLDRLQAKGISVVFHAHTHKAWSSISEGSIAEIGCGSFSGDLYDMEKIMHQFTMGSICVNDSLIVERWIDVADGTDGFASEQLYPRERRFTDPNSATKVSYPPAEKYVIQRHLSPRSTTSSIFGLGDQGEEGIPLEIANQHKRLLILADGGQGKSVLLEQLAYEFCSTSYFPFHYTLKDYTGQDIQEILPSTYQSLNPGYLVLILDGYDELVTDQIINFESKLRCYLKENPAANVILSSRSNFCKVEQGTESKTFPGFYVCNLCHISKRDQDGYLSGRELDAKTFHQAAVDEGVTSLCTNPFYLAGLADIFEKTNTLPSRSDLMSEIIIFSFEKDSAKYPENLEFHYEDIFAGLRKAAFAMQLMGTAALQDREQYQVILNFEEREFVKQSGILKLCGDGWRFTHAIFREYLAAQYLAHLPQNEVVTVIYCAGTIRPNWVNTVGFLADMKLDWDFQGWLLNNVPEILAKFENDRVDEDTRDSIFQKLFCEYERKYLLYQNPLCSEEELVQFNSSWGACKFLMNRALHPQNNPSQRSALYVLSCFPQPTGPRKQQIMREMLLSICCADPPPCPEICKLCIHALLKLHLVTEQVTDRLMKAFSSTESDIIRLELYRYLNEGQVQDQYSKFFLDGLDLIERDRGHHRVINERTTLMDGLAQMSTPENITDVLKRCTDHEERITHGVDRVITSLCEKASELYSSGTDNLFESVLDFCVCSLKKYLYGNVKNAMEFFRSTGTLERAVIDLAKQAKESWDYMAEIFQNYTDAFDCLEQAYRQNRLADSTFFDKMVIDCVHDKARYAYYQHLILEKDGRKIPDQRPRQNYRVRRERASQEFLRCLFSPEKAEKRIHELVRISGIENPTVEQLEDTLLELHNGPTPLRALHNSMRQYGGESMLALDFCKKANWNVVLLNEVDGLIGEKWATLTKEQLQRLRDAANSLIEKCISDFLNTSLMASIVTVVLKLNMQLPREILIRMTAIQGFFFENDHASEKKYEFLKKHLSHDDIEQQLIHDVQEYLKQDDPYKKIQESVLSDHFCYLLGTEHDDLVEEAVAICKRTNISAYYRKDAVKYIQKFEDKSFLWEEVLKEADTELLMALLEPQDEVSDKLLISAIERAYLRTNDQRLLEPLLAAQNLTGLRAYVGLVRQENGIPSIEGGQDLTYQIDHLRNKECMPLLQELIPVVLSPEFKDRNIFSLRDAVANAFSTCGAAAAEEAKTYMNQQIQFVEQQFNQGKLTLEQKEKQLTWCNYVLEDLRRAQIKYEDRPLTLMETVARLKGEGDK